jgi:hypothetical protein
MTRRLISGRRRKTKPFALLSALSVLILLVSLSCTGVSGEYEITNFDLGNGRTVEILASEDAEVSQSFYYQVRVNKKIVVPLVMICVGHDRGQLTFKTLPAKDGDLVGIFEQKQPEEMLAIHDFKSNATWPGFLAPDQEAEFRLSGNLLLRDLQAEHQNMQLTLANGRACE